MRIPRAHALTMEYIEKFGLLTNDFTMDNPNAYYYIGGRKVRAAMPPSDPVPARIRCLRGRTRQDRRPDVHPGHPAAIDMLEAER